MRKFVPRYPLRAQSRIGWAMWSRRWALLLLGWWISGCSPSAGSGNQASVNNEPAPAVERGASNGRLRALRAARNADAFANKLAIGPGDVIEVTVAHVPELDKYKVRVSQDNTIALPLAGVVPVGEIGRAHV